MALLSETLSKIVEQSGGDIIRSDGQKRYQSTFSKIEKPKIEYMGQFLQGGNFGCFRSLFLRVKGGEKTFPYKLLAAVTNNLSKLKLFERGPRF